MDDLIKFYNNSLKANNKHGYYIKDIIEKWDDYKLENEHDFIQWLFPDEGGGSNSNVPELTQEDIEIFKTNNDIRYLVIKATQRMLLFYGYIISFDFQLTQIYPLNRRQNGLTIGLFSEHNYKRITRIMKFLSVINMEFLSAIFFLAMCHAVKSDKKLYEMVKNYKALPKWIKTQNYLNKKCSITGLNYTGNSCYMDSSLLCTFAVPNKIITDNILEKDLDVLKNEPILWSRCTDNLDQDIQRRKDIQNSIKRITNSMRGFDTIEKCSDFRRLLKKCPVSQQFHGTDTQDAGEFLTYLFNLFQVDIAFTKRDTFGRNLITSEWEFVSTSDDKKSSPILDVVSSTLKQVEDGYNITRFVEKKEYAVLTNENKWKPYINKPNITYLYKKEVIKMVNSPLIVFNLIRTYGKIKFNKKGEFLDIKTKNIWKKISAPETMILNNKHLKLTAIVVHTGGAHYIAHFKCLDEWYWYDDNPGSSKHIINYIGSYEKMLETEPSPLTHGTLFFYT